jgi:hypothetical protein
VSANDITAHLIAFAETTLRDMDKASARAYLRRCLAHWREHYGADVAAEMERRIREMLGKK